MLADKKNKMSLPPCKRMAAELLAGYKAYLLRIAVLQTEPGKLL